MSLIRDPVIITAVGHQMMTAGGDITYTKATLYGQDISHLTKDQLESLTSIGNPLLTVPVGISDKSDNDNATTVVIEATFQNSNLKADLPYSAVGFFAKKGNNAEKLVVVGVANPGAYLVATPPDGVATDALDIKVAIAIGDATSVTAVVDPAGSVTPATLNSAINNLNHDITVKIDANQDSTAKALGTKADKTTVSDQLATKANQSDLDKTNAEVVKKADSADVTAQLDTKADKTDVANSVKQLQAGIDSKADKSVVDAEIAKIDFTPYAKSADVANELQNYTTTVDLNKLLAGKEDAGTSYSKTELDKKLLALSTDTDGKVNVDQVSSMIANKVDKSDLASDLKAVNDSIATKANSSDVDSALAKKDDVTDVDAKIKTVTDLANTKANADDVEKELATKANTSDVNSALAKKDDTTDVDAKIKTVTDLANIKANSSDVYTKSAVDTAFSQRDSNITKAQNEVDQLKGRRTVDSADFNSLTDGGTYYITSPGKNAPVSQWGNLFVSNGNGHRVSQVYFPDDGNAPWYRVLDEQDWRGWVQLGTKSDANNAANLANSASNKVDTVLTNSYVRKQGMNQNGDLVEIKNTGIKQDNGGYAFDMWSDDWTASKLKDVLGQLPSKANSSDVSALQNKVNISSNLFRQIQNSNNWNDIFGVDNPNNVLTSLRIDSGGSGSLINDFAAGIGFGGGDTKGVLSVDYGNHLARITGGNGTGPVWSEDIAWNSDINDLRNQIQQLKDNQFEVQTFTDATAAANWESQRPGKRMAIVNK